MLKNKNRILAVDPGAREMGVVVLDETELIYYGVKSLKKFRPEPVLRKAVKEILIKVIIEYDVKTLVIENGWFSQESSPLFQTVFRTIKHVAKEKKLMLATYAPKTIRKFICGDGKATKKRTAQILANRYPELEIYLEQNYRWKEKYWLNVFDALAAGLTHVMQNQENGQN
jgi:Holliday junction resolvasome RuvABC endonuclease subunit